MDTVSDMSIFVSVVDEGSISASARALGLPRSTISRRLSALERRLEVTLVQRTTRKLRLTEAGRIFHARCQQILEDTARAEAEVRELDAATAGVIRVGAPSGIGTEWFRVQIAEFFDIYPDIRLELILEHRARDLHDEDLDLAVVRGPLPDSLLIARRIAPADLLSERDIRPTSDVRLHAATLLHQMFGLDWAALGSAVFPGLDVGPPALPLTL